MLVVPVRIGVWLAGIVVAACGAATLGRRGEWLGVWALTDSYLGDALLIMLPAAAGCGAWLGSLVRRSGLTDLAEFGTIDPLRVEARIAVEFAAWLTLGVVASTALAWIDTARFATVMSPQITLLLARLTIMWFAGALGFLAGRWLPAMVAVPSALVAPYVVPAALSYFADPLLAALTPLESGFTQFSRASVVPSLLETLVWLLAAAALVLLLARRARWAFACAWLAGVTAAPLLLIGDADREYVPWAAAPVCERSERFLVCLPRATSFLNPRLAQDLRRASDVLGGLAPRRVAWIEEGGEGGVATDARWLDAWTEARAGDYDLTWREKVGGIGIYPQPSHGYLRAQLLAAWVPQSTHFDASGDLTPVSPNEAILHWAVDRADASFGHVPSYSSEAPREVDGTHRGQMRWFADLAPAARAQFLSAHADDIKHGRLEWSDFGA